MAGNIAHAEELTNMNAIAKLALAAVFSSVFCVALSNAQDAAKPATPMWNDVLKTCSAEYKERADKTKGREVWQSFLTECKARKGFVSKKDQGKNVEFTRIPDKN